jgi:hypothetical protein
MEEVAVDDVEATLALGLADELRITGVGDDGELTTAELKATFGIAAWADATTAFEDDWG